MSTISGTTKNQIDDVVTVQSGWDCCSGCNFGICPDVQVFLTDSNGTWTLTSNTTPHSFCSMIGTGFATKQIGALGSISGCTPVGFETEDVAITESGTVQYDIQMSWSTGTGFVVSFSWAQGCGPNECAVNGSPTTGQLGYYCPNGPSSCIVGEGGLARFPYLEGGVSQNGTATSAVCDGTGGMWTFELAADTGAGACAVPLDAPLIGSAGDFVTVSS